MDDIWIMPTLRRKGKGVMKMQILKSRNPERPKMTVWIDPSRCRILDIKELADQGVVHTTGRKLAVQRATFNLALNTNTLVVVPNQMIADTWIRDLDRFNEDREPKAELKVTTVQEVPKVNFLQFKTLIVDELHPDQYKRLAKELAGCKFDTLIYAAHGYMETKK